MSKFKIGDKVRVLTLGARTWLPKKLCGENGIVCDVTPNGYSANFLGVYFPEIEDRGVLHGCNGHCPEHHGYYIPEKYLARIEPPKQTIVITNDGKTTRAVLREGKHTVREATAVCHDRDTFDLEKGANIALNRLFGWKLDSDDPMMFSRTSQNPEKPKLYNAKVVCVKSSAKWWTAGKVYEIKDSVITDDEGAGRIVSAPLPRFSTAEFIPFVEE